MMFKHLRDDAYYADFYDLLTIKSCLETLRSYDATTKKLFSNKEFVSHKKEDQIKAVNVATHLLLYYQKGDLYAKKNETIQQWMNRDRAKDEKVDKAIPPSRVICPSCGNYMDVTDKELHETKGKENVLFFFECPKCDKRKAVFENGEVWQRMPTPCPKCGRELTLTHSRNKNVITTVYSCMKCKHTHKEVDDWDIESELWDAKQNEDRKLLAKYRSEYCLSEQEGQEYITQTIQTQHLHDLIDETERKKNDPNYQKAIKLKKLSVIELEKHLLQTIKGGQYTSLSLGKPEIDKYVIVPFTVLDMNSERNKMQSEYDLKRLLKKSLEKTNWRLMSDGVSYRLGCLSGRLKGYERNEDIMSIVEVI